MKVVEVLAVTASLGAALSGCGGGTTTTTSTSTAAAATVVVQVTSPASGTVINANNVTVRGTVVPATATVTVDGQPAAVGNGVFTASAHLDVGKTTIDVIGSDPGKSPGSTTIVITRPGSPSSGRTSSGKTSNTPSSSGSSATPGVANAAPGSGASGRTPCGGGLSVGPNTSCSFAQNVRAMYQAQGAGTYAVYSNVTGQSYMMSCSPNGAEVVCTGGNNASVYFP